MAEEADVVAMAVLFGAGAVFAGAMVPIVRGGLRPEAPPRAAYDQSVFDAIVTNALFYTLMGITIDITGRAISYVRTHDKLPSEEELLRPYD